jgi:Domain of unknown function (DUF2760)
MSLGLAFRAFFAVLSRRESAERVRAALDPSFAKPQEALPAPSKSSEKPSPAGTKPAEAPPKRSEALTLLSALQREARLIDLVMEPLEGVEDAAIGAAVREVFRDSQKTLNRMFALQPLADEQEGESIDLPAAPSPAMYRLVGSASTAVRGTIAHRGWRATKCEVPKWTGAASESNVLAPIEVEVG